MLSNNAGLKTATWLLYCLRLRSRSPHNAQHSTSYDSLCRRSSRSPIMLSILLVIGRAGASPPSRTAAIIFLYIYIYIYIRVVRRALNLLRAYFSPIFQYFSAVNVTRVSFSPIFQYFLTCMRYDIYMHAVHSASAWRHEPWIRQPWTVPSTHRDFRAEEVLFIEL